MTSEQKIRQARNFVRNFDTFQFGLHGEYLFL